MRKRELAGYLQRTEAVVIGTYIDPTPAYAKAVGAATKRIGGVYCLGTRKLDVPFLNRALGLGTLVDATPALIDRIEHHYVSIGKEARFAIATGCVALGTLRLLERRGYAVPDDEESELIYVYDRARPPAAPSVDGLTIVEATPALAKTYAKTAYDSFRDRGPQFEGIIEALVRQERRGLRAFLGRINGEPAATGMLFDVRPVGGLGNGSVLAKFRGHGLQRAMIVHRMREAWRRGYRIFFGQTVNPASAHNLEELGWRLLYRERTWERTG